MTKDGANVCTLYTSSKTWIIWFVHTVYILNECGTINCTLCTPVIKMGQLIALYICSQKEISVHSMDT